MAATICWFEEIGSGDIGLVGGKGANLGEMTQAGLPVPPGFCVTASAYRSFIESTNLNRTIQEILGHMAEDDPAQVEQGTSRIRAAILNQPIPQAMAEEILSAYQSLSERMPLQTPAVPTAVRSSATAEDLPTASFAGQQDTYLNIVGESALLDSIRRCWASLWTARAVSYRTRQGFNHQNLYLSVVVQAMVPSQVSGIMFTVNPISGKRDEVVINASWGLGEAVVSGLVTPDTYTAHKTSGEIISQEIGSKSTQIVYAKDGGTIEQETAESARSIAALTDQQTAELVAIGRQIETHYGTPQDIEWGLVEDNWYILQSRPITTLAPATTLNPDADEFNRSMFIEIFPDPLSPMLLSVIRPLFKGMLDFTFSTLGFTPPRSTKAIGVFYNQPYFNRRYIEVALLPLSPKVRAPLVAQIVNPFGKEQHEAASELSLPYLRMLLNTLRFMVRFPSQLPGLLDRYHRDVEAVENFPLAGASDREITEQIHHLLFESAHKLLDYDFLMIAVIGRTYRLLGALLSRYYGEEADELVAKLISGVTGNVTMETNKHLWDLAEKAKAYPEVEALLRKKDESEFLQQAENIDGGREWLAALFTFLAEFGHREIRMDILYPTWKEDPVPVVSFIRSYMDADESQSPHSQQARLVRERNELTTEVLDKVDETLAGRVLIAPVFRWLLHQTQIHTRERDTMHFEITRMFPPARRLLLELGKRWTRRGLIKAVEDIYYLEINELLELANSPRSMKAEVEARRDEFTRSGKTRWPEVIRDGQEFFAYSPDASTESGDVLQGVAGSPGVVSGIARVIRGPEEFDKLQKGDILVAPLTNPVWTPLFAVAGGVITEVGGILSHGAIVAREYGIPAVMSVSGATRLVSEGQHITVNGDKGFVHLLAAGPA